jgi:hypothetical protein
VRDDLIAALLGLKDTETGEAVFGAAHHREELWSGPRVAELPDVMVEQKGGLYSVNCFRSAGQELIYPLSSKGADRWCKSGRHRPHGILMAAGPHVRGGSPRNAWIGDVPATVLALLGCPVPETFDGRVLSEILSDELRAPGKTRTRSHGRQEEEELTREQQDAVRERLEGLGYL